MESRVWLPSGGGLERLRRERLERSVPQLEGLAVVRALEGTSGVEVLLCSRDGRRYFVRKIARGPAALALRAQARKMERAGHSSPILRAPAVLDEGEQGDLYWFDQAHVAGMDAVSYLLRASITEVRSFAARLGDALEHAQVASAHVESSQSSVFGSAYRTVCALGADEERPLPSNVLARLFLGLERLHGLERRTSTACHGDLSFDNLLVRPDGSLVAVDWTPVGFEHVSLDAARLHVELAGGAYLSDRRALSEGVLDHLRRALMDRMAGLDPSFLDVCPILTAVGFAGALPRCRNADDRAFVLDRVEHFARLSVRRLRAVRDHG